ncbi:hypothetical protein ACFLIM_39040 [Nonomuraea sp. M3C6]|uniref:Uncharacterized protein n=1 Tax=Nonomuraea marmarensis TaxID=3351344 RepID=A0ABW7AP66_9ACTN
MITYMSIRMIVLACDTDHCANLCGITEPTSINDARSTASAAFGWTKAGDLDHCKTCSSTHGPGSSYSSLMVFSHYESSTREHDQDPPRTRSDAS